MKFKITDDDIIIGGLRNTCPVILTIERGRRMQPTEFDLDIPVEMLRGQGPPIVCSLDCDCTSPEHSVRFTYDEFYRTIEVDWFLHHHASRWTRFLRGIKYILGYGTADFCGMMFKADTLERLYEWSGHVLNLESIHDCKNSKVNLADNPTAAPDSNAARR